MLFEKCQVLLFIISQLIWISVLTAKDKEIQRTADSLNFKINWEVNFVFFDNHSQNFLDQFKKPSQA